MDEVVLVIDEVEVSEDKSKLIIALFTSMPNPYPTTYEFDGEKLNYDLPMPKTAQKRFAKMLNKDYGMPPYDQVVVDKIFEDNSRYKI